jgi:hypothetical protein
MANPLAAAETRDLISAARVAGTPVFAVDGDKLGSIQSVMISKATGQVAYVVMAYGGFLGLAVRRHPLPWSVLDYDPDVGGYRLGRPVGDLDAAPALADDADEDDHLADPDVRARIDAHFGR